MKTRPTSGTLAVAVCLALMATASANLLAATITVTSTADSGGGSLRAALATAANGDTINFSLTTPATITLTSGELLLTKSLTILGPGDGNLAVDGNATSRVFHIAPSNTVTIVSLVVTNGVVSGRNIPANFGGGIFNDNSTLTVSNCTLSGNLASRSVIGSGGAIFNRGTLTVVNSALSNNSAYDGGAIFNNLASLQIVNSTLSGNSAVSGGGIFNEGRSPRRDVSASLQIVNSTLSGNSAGGGGAIENINGMLTLSNSTLSGNSAIYGGGVENIGLAEIVNSTLSGNTGGVGGGVLNNGTLVIINSTFSRNLAASIYNSSGRSMGVEIGSTILNAAALSANIVNEFGPVTSLGYNLSSDAAGGLLTATGDQIDTDPMLGPLQDNGGLIFTHAPLSGSPAIDKGKNFSASTTDGRGGGFARTFDDPCVTNAIGGDGTDVGAVEGQAFSPCEAIAALVAIIESSDLPRHRKRPLIASLEEACASFRKRHPAHGVQQLRAFQKKVTAQVSPSDPALAQKLVTTAQGIIDSLCGPS